MVSSTKHSERRRAINASRAGRSDKRKRAKTGTPAFPIQPEGYDPKAPDAKKKKSA
jgi:hypothetical protein